MIGHLGSRVAALVDGRLSPAEEERAWAHVHQCLQCRDLVAREGWIKTQLAGWSSANTRCPESSLKARLLAHPVLAPPPTVHAMLAPPSHAALAPPSHAALTPPSHPLGHPSRGAATAFGALGAVGIAMVGVLTLGVSPAAAPSGDRRLPVGSVGDHTTPRPPSVVRQGSVVRPGQSSRESPLSVTSVKIAG